jgi:hypothetical protein
MVSGSTAGKVLRESSIVYLRECCQRAVAKAGV